MCFVDVESVSSVWVTPVGLVGWLVGWGVGVWLGKKSWDIFLRNGPFRNYGRYGRYGEIMEIIYLK